MLKKTISSLKQFSFPVLIISSILLCSCMPRGETISLDQSLNIAKDRFENAMLQSKTKLPTEIAGSLGTLSEDVSKLSAVSSASEFRAESKDIAASLKSLTLKAGYTSRVSFDELSKQFTTAADENSGNEFQAGVAKLLAQRTYHLLSAELETTKFAL